MIFMILLAFEIISHRNLLSQLIKLCCMGFQHLVSNDPSTICYSVVTNARVPTRDVHFIIIMYRLLPRIIRTFFPPK